MIPLPSDAKANMRNWLPHVLGGYDYPVKETDAVAPDLIAPAITFHFSSAGTPARYSNDLIRTVRNTDGTLDDYWGEFYYATMAVILRANDHEELQTMWEQFLRKCPATRRDLNLRLDHVRFVEILNSKSLETARTKDGKDLFWAQVDLRFEYEVSDISDADYIKSAHTNIQVGRPAEHYSYIDFDEPNDDDEPTRIGDERPYI